MRPGIRFFPCAAVVFSICLFSTQASRADSRPQVRAGLNDLDSWLGSGANADTWAAYLKLKVLRAELDKEDKADLAVVGAVRKQLESGAAGLELAPFGRLRGSVAAWSEDLAVAQAPSLPEAVLAAESRFKLITAADVAASKARLQAGADRLGRYLRGDNGAAWKKYLAWSALEAQLKSDTPDVEVLKTVKQKFLADQNGLEMPVFAAVADALDRYIHDLSGRGDELRAQF